MKVIFIPGFWDSVEKFEVLAEVLVSNNIEYKILDYRNYKSYGKILNTHTFSEILSALIGSDTDNTILISYSMGASFVYDFLSTHELRPAKIIFINPLLENVGNPFVASYNRVLDMYLQGQLLKAIVTAHKGLFPLMDIALFQQDYNKKIVFGKKLNLDATFVWSEKDLICPIKNYENYKEYFAKTKLVIIPDHHHNWLVYREPIEDFLLKEILR